MRLEPGNERHAERQDERQNAEGREAIGPLVPDWVGAVHEPDDDGDEADDVDREPDEPVPDERLVDGHPDQVEHGRHDNGEGVLQPPPVVGVGHEQTAADPAGGHENQHGKHAHGDVADDVLGPSVHSLFLPRFRPGCCSALCATSCPDQRRQHASIRLLTT